VCHLGCHLGASVTHLPWGYTPLWVQQNLAWGLLLHRMDHFEGVKCLVAILYIKATVFVCLSGQFPGTGTARTFFLNFFMGFVFCDSYYPTDRAGANTGGGGLAQAGGARARKDRTRGSSTGALCTRFTLVETELNCY